MRLSYVRPLLRLCPKSSPPQQLQKKFYGSLSQCISASSFRRQNQAQQSWCSTIPCQSFHSSSVQQGEVVQFNLADIGEGIAQVHVTEWYVEVGDKVNQFDQICEVKSDKASVTITSRYQGTVTKLYYEVDEEANVGSPIVDIELETGEEDTSRFVSEPEPILEEAVSATQQTLPPPPPPPPSSATTIPAEDRTPPTSASPPADAMFDTSSRVVPATPAVRKIAKENKVNLADVTATGSGGRVLKEDILNFIAERKQSKTPTASPSVASIPAVRPQVSAPVPMAEDRVEPIKGIRKAMVQSMIASLEVPTAVYCDEVNMTELIKLRKSLNKQSGDVKLTFMPFFCEGGILGDPSTPYCEQSN